jgi:hypothetical protein
MVTHHAPARSSLRRRAPASPNETNCHNGDPFGPRQVLSFRRREARLARTALRRESCLPGSVARSPLGLLKGVPSPRDLAGRSVRVVSGAVGYAQALKQGTVPGPLLLAIRAANQLAERILEQPAPTPTAAQRRTLLAVAAQLRAMTSQIIVTADSRDAHSTEAELAQLIKRTLTLIERVTAETLSLDPRAVIDTEAWLAPSSDSDPAQSKSE